MGLECQSCSGHKCLLLFIFITHYFYAKTGILRRGGPQSGASYFISEWNTISLAHYNRQRVRRDAVRRTARKEVSYDVFNTGLTSLSAYYTLTS